MGGESGEASRIVEFARAEVERAPNFKVALRALATALDYVFGGLVRISVRVLVPEREAVMVAGVWSRGPTRLKAGSILELVATATPEVLKTKRPVFGGSASPEEPVDQILKEEGVRAWVSIPLRARGAIVGTLTLSSSRPGAFSPAGEPFLSSLAEALESSLLGLVPPRTD